MYALIKGLLDDETACSQSKLGRREGKSARLGKSTQIYTSHPLLFNNSVIDTIIVCPISIRAFSMSDIHRFGSFHTHIITLFIEP